MFRFALKNLLDDRGQLFISVVGVAAALVLVLLLDGVFAGTSEQIVAYPTHTRADVWVMQDGVSNMHMATSIVPRDREQAIRQVDGVRDVTPILYVNNFVESGEREWFSYIVGIEADAARGGPWAIARGAAMPGPGEVVIPEVIADQAELGLGDTVSIMGRRFAIAGLSEQTFSMANSITFLHYPDLEQLMTAEGQSSYFLVAAQPGVAAAELTARIDAQVDGVHAMSRRDFIESDRKMALQMGADIIRIMTFVGLAVSVLIIGFAMYTATIRRRREFAVAKALGARNRQLFGIAVAQTMIVTALAFGLAIGLAFALRPLIHRLVPEVAVVYPLWSIARLALAALAIGVVASWIPSRRTMRIDPATVFRE